MRFQTWAQYKDFSPARKRSVSKVLIERKSSVHLLRIPRLSSVLLFDSGQVRLNFEKPWSSNKWMTTISNSLLRTPKDRRTSEFPNWRWPALASDCSHKIDFKDQPVGSKSNSPVLKWNLKKSTRASISDIRKGLVLIRKTKKSGSPYNPLLVELDNLKSAFLISV